MHAAGATSLHAAIVHYKYVPTHKRRQRLDIHGIALHGASAAVVR